MLDREALFTRYRISSETFESTKLEWAHLEEIFNDYKCVYDELHDTGRLISEHLGRIRAVHSLKVRIKDPEHLIEKIIRKKSEDSSREFNLGNYQTEITDLIGVRALHLFKDDWSEIHKEIIRIWDLHEEPIAYIREGDYIEDFKENGCRIVEHPAGYRSVHYLVKSQATKRLSIAEIQVRTLFEEGWSEIDHQMRYPYEVDNLLLAGYLAVFNRLAGNADEMGTYVKRLNLALKEREREFNEQLAEQEREKAKVIERLKGVTKKLEKETEEKKELQRVIDKLEKQEPPARPSTTSLPVSAYSSSSYLNSQKSICMGCGQAYEPTSLLREAAGIQYCPNCSSSRTGLGTTRASVFPSTGLMSQKQKCKVCNFESDSLGITTVTCPRCHSLLL
jgi:ppGpp synthetase/RelA/SpoT-type nucleotidyltranferase